MPRLVVSVPSADLAADLTGLPDGVEVIQWAMDAPAPRDTIDLVVTPYLGVSARMTFPLLEGVHTRLVQGQSIGYEHVAAHLPAGHVFANAAGAHEASTAELAMALVLAAQREIPRFVRAQDAQVWDDGFTRSLADRRVLLLGYGGVGKAIAARLTPFDVDLTVVAHRARQEGDLHVHGVSELASLLPDTEVLIAVVPGGDATRHVIDDAALSTLPDGALVVNVGRGPAIDTDALVEHVRLGRIRAALDVTDPEPLPKDHPLWSLPGVLIAPHVGGNSTAMRPRILRLIRTQVDHLLAGEEPVNIVLRH